MVDSSNPWFANLDVFSTGDNLDIQTKSSVSLVSFSSLLDFSSAEEMTIGSRHIKQIPFIGNSSPEYFYLSKAIPEDGEMSMDSVMVSKMFLIESEDIDNESDPSKTVTYVVTMLARYKYCTDYGFDDISYLHHPFFSGVIIFSEPDSKYDYLSYYEGGDLYQAELVAQNEENNFYITHLEILGTKGGSYSIGEGTVNGGVLNEASCVASASSGSRVIVLVYSTVGNSTKERISHIK